MSSWINLCSSPEILNPFLHYRTMDPYDLLMGRRMRLIAPVVTIFAAGVVLDTGHKEGDNLVWKGEVTMMGKRYSVKDVLCDRTPTSYTLTSYSNDGSGEKKVMTIKAKKQGAAAAR